MLRLNKAIFFIAFASLVLTGCEGVDTKASYPTRQSGSDQILYSDQKRETVWGDEGDSISKKLFGDENDKISKSGIGVNSFLWRASLDTIAFMPITSADPFGGVVITDWYENPEVKGERYKLNIYILDRQLRADGIKVSAFKQKLDKKNVWRDIETPNDLSLNIENSILTRARELRIAQMGGFKDK